MSIEIKFLLHPIGSGYDSLTLKGTGRIVACRDVPSPAEFRSRPEGIRKVGVRRSSTGELFFVREPSASRHRAAVSALYLVPTSDIPSMEFSPDERGRA